MKTLTISNKLTSASYFKEEEIFSFIVGAATIFVHGPHLGQIGYVKVTKVDLCGSDAAREGCSLEICSVFGDLTRRF